MAENGCRVCPDQLPKHHRRTIFGPTFNVGSQLTEVLGYVPHPDDVLSKYVCGFCYTKLNILSKIDFDLVHRIDALRSEKQDTIKVLRAKIVSRHVVSKPDSVTRTASPKTPLKIATPKAKRTLIHSPTPRKIKRDRLASSSCTRSILPSLPKPGTDTDSRCMERKSISVKLFSPGKAKASDFNLMFFLSLIKQTFKMFQAETRWGGGKIIMLHFITQIFDR